MQRPMALRRLGVTLRHQVSRFFVQSLSKGGQCGNLRILRRKVLHQFYGTLIVFKRLARAPLRNQKIHRS